MNDVQGMYDQIMGSRNPTTGEAMSPRETLGTQEGPAGGTLIHNPTINQQIRNRHIVRNQFGVPLGKMPTKTFVPASKAESKQAIKNDKFTMFETSYNATREKALEEQIEHKRRTIGGQFLCSKAFDNNIGPDWSQKTHKERMKTTLQSTDIKRSTLMTTGDAFISGGNKYETQLTDFDEMPRLSILNNYKRIKQIMNKNYVKGFEMEQKYRNRTQQDNEHDPEWAKYNEEKLNSQKMSTILRSLNGNKKKHRPLAPSQSAVGQAMLQSSATKAKNSVSQARPKISSMSGIKPLQEAAEYEEISNF